MELIWFIAGILFYLLIAPILEAFTSYLITVIESKKIKYTETINNGNIRMQKAASSITDECPSRAIGFVLSEEEESDDEEDF